MWKKLAAATVVTGALAMGSVAVAAAAPTPSASPAPAAAPGATHPRCADEPRALARIQQAEGKIATRLTKLATFEQWAQSNDHARLAARIERRIDRLETLQARGQARSSKIEARCPPSSGGADSTTSAGQGATTLT